MLVAEALVGGRSVELPTCLSLAVTLHRCDDEAAQLSEMIDGNAYEHVIVLAYRDGLSLAEVDAHSLLILSPCDGLGRGWPWPLGW